jgi:protocatechuate 3,4-dioxygenase beta subunit
MSTLHDDTPAGHRLSRRRLIGLLGTTAGAAALAPLLGMRRAFLPAAHAENAPPCVVRPDLTEGPFFVDEELLRADIRSDPATGEVSAGTPLAISFLVSRLDSASCRPLAGARVDVWQCDALGAYSGVADTAKKKFLRGAQITDESGRASFLTIYPGWYRGRTVHIHFKIRSRTNAAAASEFSSQLFFDEALTDAVHASAPYSSRGMRTLRNDDDWIYRRGGSALMLDVGPDGSGGYAATFDIGLETPA